MELMQPYGPASTSILRYGRALLQAWLLGTVAIVIGISIVAPERVWLVPLVMAAVGGAGWILTRPTWAIYAAVALFVTAMNMEDGLQPNQILYGLFAYGALGSWYAWRFHQPQALVRTHVDRVVAVLLVGGLPLGILTGIAFGADFLLMRGEVIAFSMLAFYFPVKEICRNEKRGPEIIIGLVLFIAVAVVVRNALSLHATISSAVYAWEIADARPGQGRAFNLKETQLMAGAIATLVLLLHSSAWRWRILLLGLLGVFVLALVMTRSRGYWLAFALGIVALFFMSRGRIRWQLVTLVIAGSAVALGGMILVLGPIITDLILGGTIARFSTLETAATADVSLVNRFAESAAAIRKGIGSPILGWGFGSYFYHYDLIRLQTEKDFFIHNGYVSLWFKHGIWGLLLFIFVWLSSIICGVNTVRQSGAAPFHRAAAAIASVFMVAILLSTLTSNPFVVRDQLFYFALFAGVACGIHQRYIRHSSALSLRDG